MANAIAVQTFKTKYSKDGIIFNGFEYGFDKVSKDGDSCFWRC
jgi:hypothetical protein